ncbi:MULTISPECIES: DUF1266 domain-containing protein [unclassified Leucobacter]|uniref:DUF1266 domain-containing protein n=1 Tax=unclassified Leucobacter TaxID=2621730 RepID=UPI0006214C01|nr:DUF1266 domain-containing protein [Leucobacter sp. Ag1]KKI16722.1 hypothetical protein XM48_13925 [Leucobacter sp. Ag1]
MEIVTQFFDWFWDPANAVIRWIIIGVLVVALLFVLLWAYGKFAPLAHHKDFPVDTREANLLALGFQQILNSGELWNDPTASTLTAKQKQELARMWGLNSTQDVVENVERLTTQRRRRELWQQLLALRARAAQANGGRRPSERQWIAAIKEAGGTGKGEERDFVRAVNYYEKELGKKMFPANEPVVSLDGYALGQAAAVPVWGVGMGLISRADSMKLVEYVNGLARTEFDSWAAFGRSYALGRVMHWSDGTMDEKQASRGGDAVAAMQHALDGKRRGPWGLLPWRI